MTRDSNESQFQALAHVTSAFDAQVVQSMAQVTPAFQDYGLISDDIMQYIYTINLSVICLLISLFGIVANCINIAVFVRQDFKDTVNISLLALSISDLWSLIALLWVSICYLPLFMYSDLPILTNDLQLLPGGWTHIMFTRVTGFITVFITLERFLCVVFPLKVKTLLTPKRVKKIIASIYVVIIGSMSPMYSHYRFDWKFIESLNRSVIGNVHRIEAGDRTISYICYYVQLCYIAISFTAVVVFTIALILKIHQRRRWRQTVTSGNSDMKVMVRDRRVVKMMIHVALIFIISFIPSFILFILMLVIPGTVDGQKNENLFILSCSISYLLEGINSSVNIFVYYRMSSKYRQQFKAYCFGRNN